MLYFITVYLNNECDIIVLKETKRNPFHGIVYNLFYTQYLYHIYKWKGGIMQNRKGCLCCTS
jgi:hypothetical protein